MAAYEMDILGELFPENTRRRHHEFKRSSDEYARKIAMKDIQAELRQNRKKGMADINYQSSRDKLHQYGSFMLLSTVLISRSGKSAKMFGSRRTKTAIGRPYHHFLTLNCTRIRKMFML